jgi:hypothetical protein
MSSAKYEQYANYLIRDIGNDADLNYLINDFMKEASIDMGSDFSDETLDRVIYIIKHEFSFLAISLVASAFSRGAMGKFGAGRLVPRTICGWLNEITAEYHRKETHDSIPVDEITDTKFLHKSPLGSAICKKIDWFKSGNYDMDDWDKVPLKELSERIKGGLETVPEVFGIISIKNQKTA